MPGSTYRLQLHAEFGFADAADLAGYLASLGVTHAYLSPILQAAPGSRHGYDVVDHSRISAELGGEDGFRYLAGRLARHGIGLVVDVVPNHMGIPAPEYLNRAAVVGAGRRPGSRRTRTGSTSTGPRWAGRMLLPILAAAAAVLPGRPDRSPGSPSCRAPRRWPATDDAPVLRYQGHVLPLRGRDRAAADGRPAGRAALPAGELARGGHAS